MRMNSTSNHKGKYIIIFIIIATIDINEIENLDEIHEIEFHNRNPTKLGSLFAGGSNGNNSSLTYQAPTQPKQQQQQPAKQPQQPQQQGKGGGKSDAAPELMFASPAQLYKLYGSPCILLTPVILLHSFVFFFIVLFPFGFILRFI